MSAVTTASSRTDSSDPRPISSTNFNVAVAWTPYPVTAMRPFAPHYTLHRNEPFVAKTLWKGAVAGIKALKRLKSVVGNKSKLRSDLIMVTGHTGGYLMLWNAENYTMMGHSTHYNNVTVTQIVVTNTMIYTLVERDTLKGKAGDDSDVYIWDLNTMQHSQTLSAHEEKVTCIVVDDCNEYRCVTGGVDRTIYVWDVKRLPAPVGKLLGHHMMITSLALHDNLLISGSSDSTVRLWDLDTMTQTSLGEGHQGAVTFLAWLRKPTEIQPGGILLSACAGGIVRAWVIEAAHGATPTTTTANVGPASPNATSNPPTAQLAVLWNNKPHKALTTDVCWDDHVVMSCSAVDGVNFFHVDKKTNHKFTFGDIGVRQLAVDSTRKLLVAGTDNGQLTLLNYRGLVSPQTGDVEGVTVFTSFQPHLGAITSIVLERAMNGQWERIVTASNDHSVFVMDFDTTRDSHSWSGVAPRSIARIAQTGTIVTASENAGLLWDVIDFVKKSGAKKSLEGHTKKISSVRYSEENMKLITGSEDGFVRTWDVVQDPHGGAPTLEELREETIVQGDALDVGMAVRDLSKPYRFLVAAALQRPQSVSKAGSVVVVNFLRGTAATPQVATYVFPVSVKLFGYEGKDSLVQFVVLAQLRNGEILMLAGDEDNHLVLLRSVLHEQIPFSVEREAEGFIPMPTSYVARINTKYAPPRMELMVVDGERSIKSFSLIATDKEAHGIQDFSRLFDHNIVAFCPLSQGSVAVVVALENGLCVAIDDKGNMVYEVHYDGSVVDLAAESVRPARRRRSFLKTNPDGSTSLPMGGRVPQCSALDACNVSRYVAVGYRDGVILLWDVVQKKTCRRIYAHATAVSSVQILPKEHRLLSSSIVGAMRIDTLYARNVREAPVEGTELTPPSATASPSSEPLIERRGSRSGEVSKIVS